MGTLWQTSLTSPDPDERAQGVRVVRDVCGLAPQLGVTALLLPVGQPEGVETAQARENLVESLRACLETAQDAGVTLALENVCQPFLEGAAGLLEVVAAVDAPACGVYYDLGNASFVSQDAVEELRLVARYLVRVHAKDTVGIRRDRPPLPGVPITGDFTVWQRRTTVTLGGGETDRYYSASQLPRLNRILALKDLGFSLEQVREVLHDGVSLEELGGMLRLKRAEVERQLRDGAQRLEPIEARLKQIEQENTMPDYDVVLRTVAPTLVASRRIAIPTNDQVPDYLNPAFDEVFAFLRERGVTPSGPHLAVWHTSAETLADEDAEAAVPIDRPLDGTGRVEVRELPQVEVASAVHHGDFSKFTQLHTTLLGWIEANGYRVSGPFREIYITHNPDDLSESTTEVHYPVEKPRSA